MFEKIKDKLAFTIEKVYTFLKCKKKFFKHFFILEKIYSCKIFLYKHIKKTKFLFLIILIFYIVLLLSWRYLQTILSFPAVGYNIQDIVWYIKKDINFEEINIKTKSKENINGLYINNNSKKTVYYFHWNGWPLSYFYSEIDYIKNLGYNVMAYDYPWYWKSGWKPYYDNLINFSDVFFNYIKKEKKLRDEDIIIWWYSIWSGLAVDFASKNNFSKLVLVSPLSSRYDMSRKLFWFALQKILFIPNSFVNKDLVKKIKNPTLIIHWNKDKIIPFNQWKVIFKNSISSRKYFIEIDNWGHNSIFSSYGLILKTPIKAFLEDSYLDWNYLFLGSRNIDKLIKWIWTLNVDLEKDSSITKFVNDRVSFTKLSYIPRNLENITSDFVYDTKWWTQKLRKKAKNALENMARDFFERFNKKIMVISAYRTYNKQKSIKLRWCIDKFCAKPWFSEHQSGLAVDLWEVSDKKTFLSQKKLKSYYNWLSENAHKYGFHNTYSKWFNIDGYEIEPWHWRYLWIPLASYLNTKNMSFAEFYNIYSKF